jgi:hypothetical protein
MRVKGDHRQAVALRRQVRALAGVTAASLNPVTGGLIVHYEIAQGARERIIDGVEALVREPIAPVPRRVPDDVPVRRRPHPDLAEIIADTLAEQLVERVIRVVMAALI